MKAVIKEENIMKEGRVKDKVFVTTDVGGTFTDLVYLSEDPKTGRQQLKTAKSDTTPPNFELGVLECHGTKHWLMPNR